MSLRVSEQAVLWWCLVAAGVAVVRPLGARRRLRVIGGASSLALMVLATALLPDDGAGGAIRNVMPALYVLGAYWVAGTYFTAPQAAIEMYLLAVDRRLLAPLRLQRRLTNGPRWVLEALEAAYLAVYAMLPLGAWAAWHHAGVRGVDGYWTVVFLSEASCYVALAWLQTRPPRAIEPWASSLRMRSWFRTANETILTRGSHHMNTIPSGHAAGAVAVAIALGWLQSPLAPVFGLVALAICVATVAGRYHFVLDTVAGAIVAVVWWLVVRTWEQYFAGP